MSKKNLVGGIVLAGAAAAAAAAVVAAKKLRKPEPEEPIRLDLDDNQITDVVLEELDGDAEDCPHTPEAPQEDDSEEPEIEIEFVVSDGTPEEPEQPEA